MAESRTSLAAFETACSARLPRWPNALALGASLYVPATRPDLREVLAGDKLGRLRSLIVCTEDSVAEGDLTFALENVRQALRGLEPSSTWRFLRVRSPQQLRMLGEIDGYELFDGLVLPKVCLETLPAYAQALELYPGLPVMPVVENEVVYQPTRLARLVDGLERLTSPMIAVRIGGNDILQRLGLRRPRRLTAYDTPLREAIVNVLAILRPRGIAVTAPVFEHFGDLETLRREVELDVAYGLTTKSAIHPDQVPVIEAAYRPSAGELLEAQGIDATASPAVFGKAGSMCEKATHLRWATQVIARAGIYGVRPDEGGAAASGV
jgi:citrate lyase beta subunit